MRAAQAAERLAEFESESKALLTTFDRRDQARIRLADALRCWRGRQARKLADAAAKDEALAADLERHRAAGEAAGEAIAMVKAEIATLREDTLDRQVSQARKELSALQARAAKLDADRAVAENSADELRGADPGPGGDPAVRRRGGTFPRPSGSWVRYGCGSTRHSRPWAWPTRRWPRHRPRWTTPRAARRRPSSTRSPRPASGPPACWTLWTWRNRPATPPTHPRPPCPALLRAPAVLTRAAGRRWVRRSRRATARRPARPPKRRPLARPAPGRRVPGPGLRWVSCGGGRTSMP
ncbi:hypothetical protein GCM10020220_100080 [Nonomuraea rubra]|uniref:hypothetical protein n=1 Tax=Nonomuraea rubra TaxID=46180 RepID=UPI0031EE8DC9